MFKKLFGRKDMPTKGGDEGLSSKVEGSRWTKKFSLVLTNMEGTPVYHLANQLTIGSEVGNIVVAESSVSPRHCTFVLQQNVVSVIDHGSASGTLVNGTKIPPSRYIILEESDTILAGELEIKMKVDAEQVQTDLSEEELEEEEEASESPLKLPIANEPKKSSFAFLKNIFKRKAKMSQARPVNAKKEVKKAKSSGKPAVSFSGHSSYSTNTLVRFFAVLSDLILAYALLVILSPFDEFRSFVSDLPHLLSELFQMDWAGLWQTLVEEHPFLDEVIKDIHELFSSSSHIGPLLVLFFFLRALSTILLGVSVSEFAYGVRAHGNAVWKRLGGLLRVILGMVTGPFLIFDVPAIVSRRTYKEFMTFTHTYVSSKFLTILGILLYFPLVIGMALFSPLLQGLELPEPIFVSDQLDKRVKSVQVNSVEGEVPATLTKEMSRFLGLEMNYDAQKLSLIPMFKFSGVKKKMTYKTSLIILNKEQKRPVEVEILKTFDFREMLGIGMKGNFLLHDKFPEIYSFVYSNQTTNPAFKEKIDVKSSRKFADEVIAFTKLSLGLSADNAIEYMESYSPWLKGFMDYRLSFLSLIEFKDFDKIDFVKIGNAFFLRVSYSRQKPFDLLIPLIKGQGKIIKVEFDKKENIKQFSNQFYKFSLQEANWFLSHGTTEESETLNALQVLDLFSKLQMKNDIIAQSKAQALYGYYFEKSALILKQANAEEIELWKKSLDSILAIMEKMKEYLERHPTQVVATVTEEGAEATAEATPIDEDPRMKLYSNFQHLKEAFENKNNSYFSAE